MWSTALVVATSACLLASRPDEQGQPLSPPPEPELLGRFLTRMWVPFSSLVLCAFVAGLTFDFSTAQITATTAQKALLYSMGAIPSSLALGLLLRNAPNDVRAGQLLCGAAFPLALALVLVTPILQVMVNAGEPFNSVCGSVSIMGFVVITVVSCATLLVAGRTARIARERVVSGVLLGCSAAALAGSLAIGSLGPNGRILCMVVEAALITALAIWYARGNSLVQDDASPAMRIGAEPAQAPDIAQAPETPSFQANCDLLAGQHMLSPREREVLELLGHGYGSGYIAAQLGISENTARTHTRHIYEKLGVSSREALIDLLR